MTESHSIAEARNNLARLVHQAERGLPVALTRRGKPVAVLLSVGEYERMRAGRRSHWSAVEAWRTSVDPASLEGEDVFEDVRDRTAGREAPW